MHVVLVMNGYRKGKWAVVLNPVKTKEEKLYSFYLNATNCECVLRSSSQDNESNYNQMDFCFKAYDDGGVI